MSSGDYHSDVLEMDETMESEAEDESYDQEEVDEMLDALMDEADEDYAERRSRQNRARNRNRRQQQRTPPRASGRSAYREPINERGEVTQKQLKEFAERSAGEDRRNAEGLKVINDRLGKLDGRVDGVVSVAELHSKKIRSFDTRFKLDGALDFASSLEVQTDADGSVNLVPNIGQVFRGIVKNGALGDGKGALSNPWIVGGIGLFLRNPGIIGGLIGSGTNR